MEVEIGVAVGKMGFCHEDREEQENVCLLGFFCLFPKKIYRFMGLLEIGLFTGFMGLICWRIQC